MAAFRHDPKWLGYNYALGSKDKEQILNIATESTAMSSFLEPQSSGWKLREVMVQMKRLDTVFDEVIATIGVSDSRIFLKMDTQGYDLEVFSGAEGCLGRVLGIQSEVSVEPIYVGMPHYLDAIRCYEGYGFRLVGLTEASRHPSRNTIMEMNCFMMRLDKV